MVPSAEPSAETAATLVDLLSARAAAAPDRLAYAFLEDGRDGGERLSYGALDADARRIGAWLAARHARGTRVLLLFPAGLDILKGFFGCLYAGMIAIPAPAPEASRRKRTLPRLASIVADAGAEAVLSSGDALALTREAAAEMPALAALDIVDIAAIPVGLPWSQPAAAPDDLAYLQYTSGSTTAPKGVMISHRNVLHHARDLRAACGYGPDSISVTWLPYFHDYGLIEGLMVPLQNGTPCHVMSPFAFLKRPFAWLSAISRLRATHSQGPNFAWDQCVRRIRPEQAATLDLSCLVALGNGAEPINPAVIEGFFGAFGPRGLKLSAMCPAYGLAEATLMVSCRGPALAPRIAAFDAEALTAGRAAPAGEGLSRRVVSCGRPLGAIEVAIVDPATLKRCGPDSVGEIWVRDPCVALGYWRREADTAATFGARIADEGGGPWLRTGDLGFLHDGEVFVTSRMKDLIIVAGANHYPQDIEWTVEQCHPAVRPGHVAACGLTLDGEERLVVAPEVERGALADAAAVEGLLAAIRAAVAEGHELSVHTILVLARASLPKTASGKIQRHAVARLMHRDDGEVLARWTAGEGLRLAAATPETAE